MKMNKEIIKKIKEMKKHIPVPLEVKHAALEIHRKRTQIYPLWMAGYEEALDSMLHWLKPFWK